MGTHEANVEQLDRFLDEIHSEFPHGISEEDLATEAEKRLGWTEEQRAEFIRQAQNREIDEILHEPQSPVIFRDEPAGVDEDGNPNTAPMYYGDIHEAASYVSRRFREKQEQDE